MVWSRLYLPAGGGGGEKAEGKPEQPSKAGDVGYIEVKTFR